MVAGTAAGVAFPANPATGERNRVLIDAIAGLGEQPALCAATPEGSFQRQALALRDVVFDRITIP